MNVFLLISVIATGVSVAGVAVSGVSAAGVSVAGVVVSGVAVSGVAVAGVAVAGVAVTGVAVAGVAVTGVAVTGVAVTGVEAPPPLALGALPEGNGETVGPFGVVNTGDPFDDGAFEGVRSVTVYRDIVGVTGIQVHYVAKAKFHIRVHGSSTDDKAEFEVAYPEEFITSISGTQCLDSKLNSSFVSSITFKTSYGRSEWFGKPLMTSTPFVLEPQGGETKKLIGFLGTVGERINSLGAHFSLSSSAAKRKCSTSEIQPMIIDISGTNGSAFDDGTFDGVRKVTMKGDTGMNYLRIQYVEGDHFQIREHGSDTNVQEKEVEFEVEYPEEYITSITIYWSIISTNPQVMGIEFFTSYSRSQILGVVSTNNYELKPKNGLGPKLVGLVGSFGDSVEAIGARFCLEKDSSSIAKPVSGLFWISVLLLSCLI